MSALHCTATSERSSAVFLPLVIELMILPFSFYYYLLLHFRPTEHEYSFYFIFIFHFFQSMMMTLFEHFPKTALKNLFSAVLSCQSLADVCTDIDVSLYG